VIEVVVERFESALFEQREFALTPISLAIRRGRPFPRRVWISADIRTIGTLVVVGRWISADI
jgi:hypothetical protein